MTCKVADGYIWRPRGDMLKHCFTWHSAMQTSRSMEMLTDGSVQLLTWDIWKQSANRVCFISAEWCMQTARRHSIGGERLLREDLHKPSSTWASALPRWAGIILTWKQFDSFAWPLRNN